jgi:hypothetical protein
VGDREGGSADHVAGPAIGQGRDPGIGAILDDVKRRR